MENRILIIKQGALGDVLRTTSLLRALEGEITWVTAEAALPLFAGNPLIARLTTLGRKAEYEKECFDVVLNLDDDLEAGSLAASVKTQELVGAYLAPGGAMTYTDSASGWFEMGLLSKLGIDKANELKKTNTRTYQSYLFEMMGLTFKGEEYVLAQPAVPAPASAQPRRACSIGGFGRSGSR